MSTNPPSIIRLGHVILSVTDLEASRRFYVDLLGLNILHETPRALYLRGVEDREWTLKLERAETPGLRQLGFKAGSSEALDEIAALAKEDGLPYRWESEQDRPRVLRMQDAAGFPIAFYFGSIRHPWLLQRFDLHRGPAPQRVDHVNVFAPRVEKITKWYMERLGFRLSEYSDDEDGRMRATWLQRKGNVHDIAFTNGMGPRLHHFAYWMPDSSRIFQTCDILSAAGFDKSIERGPGRHGISNAFFLYLRDPDGHRIELYTSDYLTVDPDFEPIRWHIDNPKRQQLWGGIAPKSWFTEGSVVESFAGGWLETEEPEFAGVPAYIR
jgi:catechol 2,3-dioxygenase